MPWPLLLLTTLPAARATPAEALAPGPRELAEAQAELASRLATSEAIGRAVSRLQTAWVTSPGKGCEDPDRAALADRARHFARAWHDAVQRVRVQADRTARLVASPTVVPVVDAERRAGIDALMARVDSQEQGWLELVAWSARARLQDCGVGLRPSPGLPDATVRPEGERRAAVAVTAVGGGFLCPLGAPADGAVAVVAGAACWAEQSFCGCDPAPVEPGAVLGPPAP